MSKEAPTTKTKFGTKVYVLGWKNKDLSHIMVEVEKNGFKTDIHINSIEITDKVAEKLEISQKTT